jgi:hypothetical protein
MASTDAEALSVIYEGHHADGTASFEIRQPCDQRRPRESGRVGAARICFGGEYKASPSPIQVFKM